MNEFSRSVLSFITGYLITIVFMRNIKDIKEQLPFFIMKHGKSHIDPSGEKIWVWGIGIFQFTCVDLQNKETNSNK